MPERALRFVRRHRWSLPLSGLSALCFAELSSELREGELHDFDRLVSEAVTGSRGSLDFLMYWLTRLGDGATLTAIVVLTAAVLALVKHRREAAFLIFVGTGAGMWSFLLKQLFQRDRPEATELYVISTPSSFSFPSGHAFGSTAVLLSLLLVARALGVRGARLALSTAVTFLVVAGVATSRVYFGVHFASDVVGGVLGAAAWVALVTGFFYPAALPGERAKQPLGDVVASDAAPE